MRVVKLTLQYDGIDYVGWQRQAHGVSIQGLLEDALARIEGAPVAVVGAGRTDAGVHALGQVASARLSHPIESAALIRALNATLPSDVRVCGAEDAAPGFHARCAARAKTYRYRILAADVAPPFEHRYAWHVSGALDVERMAAAAVLLEGRHDFAAFQAAGGSAKTTVRTLRLLRVSEAPLARAWHAGDADVSRGRPDGRIVLVEVTGDGFLRHMVRAIAGTLVEVGLGRRDPASVAEALASRDRARSGPTAPAHGLFLVRVEY